jgi:ATP-dependent Clp protease, protease subunit
MKSSVEFDIDNVLDTQGVFTLFGSVDSEMSRNAVRFVLAHNSVKSPVKNITFVINSEGGDLNDAFAIIDVITHSRIPVHTLGLGQISSSGLMIFMAGTKGHRLLTTNTSVMSHQWSGTFEGKLHELMSAQADFELTTARMIEHYRRCSGLSESEIMQKLLPPHDVYLTSDQAVKLGIADRIKT